MSFKTINIKNEDFELINICKDIFLKYHPELKRLKLSNSKILFECMRYYIGTEKEYRHLIKEIDEAKK